MDVQYFQTSVCARESDDGSCPLQPLLDRLKLTTDSFIALALSEDLHTFKTENHSMNEDGKFQQGDLHIMCRYKPERKLPFECGEIIFRIFPLGDIKIDK